MPEHYVYVLLSLFDGMLYIGYTTDLERRISDHNRGNSKSTFCRSLLKLVFYECYLCPADALRGEVFQVHRWQTGSPINAEREPSYGARRDGLSEAERSPARRAKKNCSFGTKTGGFDALLDFCTYAPRFSEQSCNRSLPAEHHI
jgi:putative endonuclease